MKDQQLVARIKRGSKYAFQAPKTKGGWFDVALREDGRASGHQGPAFTNLVNRLVADSAVERTVDERDRGTARLLLTASGRRLLYEFHKIIIMPAELPDRSRRGGRG